LEKCVIKGRKQQLRAEKRADEGMRQYKKAEESLKKSSNK